MVDMTIEFPGHEPIKTNTAELKAVTKALKQSGDPVLKKLTKTPRRRREDAELLDLYATAIGLQYSFAI